MKEGLIRLGTPVEVTAPGGLIRRGYVSAFDTVVIHKKSDISAERVSVFYVDTMKPKHESFIFEGEYWVDFAVYNAKKHTCLPVYKIRAVPFADSIPHTTDKVDLEL